jgi:hypothetical protein
MVYRRLIQEHPTLCQRWNLNLPDRGLTRPPAVWQGVIYIIPTVPVPKKLEKSLILLLILLFIQYYNIQFCIIFLWQIY